MQRVYANVLDIQTVNNGDDLLLFANALNEWLDYKKINFKIKQPNLSQAEANDKKWIIRWQPFNDSDRAFADFSMRERDANRLTRTWISRLAILSTREGKGSISIDISVHDDKDCFAATERPKIVRMLLDSFECSQGGVRLPKESRAILSDGVEDFVRYTLCEPSRKDPVILLTPDEKGTFLLPLERFQSEFLGYGSLYHFVDCESCYQLTRLLGKERSCFHGGIRVYYPGFSKYSDPLSHPLLIGNYLTRINKRRELASSLALETTHLFHEPPFFQEWRDLRFVQEEQEREKLLEQIKEQKINASNAGEWKYYAESYQKENDALNHQISSLNDTVQEKTEKLALMDKSCQYWRSRATNLEQQIKQKENPSIDQHPKTIGDVASIANAQYQGLYILPEAMEKANANNYRNPEEVLSALEAMNWAAIFMNRKPLGRSLKEFFSIFGQDYESNVSSLTSKKNKKQHVFSVNGEDIVCKEHIRIGSGAHNTQDCLRIYFSSIDKIDGRWIVGSIGEHFRCQST